MATQAERKSSPANNRTALPYYSIIVPSYNRSEDVATLLESLGQLDFPPDRFEVIIADDGSTDDTARVVARYRKRVPFELRFLQQQKAGPSAARNMAMAQARGDFFIFIDSDTTVAPQWLKAIDRAVRQEGAQAFGGPDEGKPDFPPLLKAVNYTLTSFLTTGGIRGHQKKRLGKFYPRSFNMGISRQLYQQIGGFPAMHPGEDIAFSHRILKRGARVAWVPQAVVYHKRRTSLKKFFWQVFRFGLARVKLYRMDPALLEPIHAVPAVALLFYLGLSLLALLWPAAALAWKGFSAAALIVLLALGLHAAWKNRTPILILLVPLVAIIQIGGYALGFLQGWWRHVIRKEPV